MFARTRARNPSPLGRGRRAKRAGEGKLIARAFAVTPLGAAEGSPRRVTRHCIATPAVGLPELKLGSPEVNPRPHRLRKSARVRGAHVVRSSLLAERAPHRHASLCTALTCMDAPMPRTQDALGAASPTRGELARSFLTSARTSAVHIYVSPHTATAPRPY